MQSTIVKSDDDTYPRLVIRMADEWGIKIADLACLPRRLMAIDSTVVQVVDQGVDARRLNYLATPSQLFSELTQDENISSVSRRSLARLWAFFLICEDPQRRLDAREVSTLSH